MAIRSRKNQYFGVNAHANSLMQDPDYGWQSFHHVHITDLTRSLNDVLPSDYIAISDCGDDELGATEIHRRCGELITHIELLSPAK